MHFHWKIIHRAICSETRLQKMKQSNGTVNDVAYNTKAMFTNFELAIFLL